MAEWVTVKIPKETKEAIDKYMEENPALGYHSTANFVVDAIRRHLIYLNALKQRGIDITGIAKPDEFEDDLET